LTKNGTNIHCLDELPTKDYKESYGNFNFEICTGTNTESYRDNSALLESSIWAKKYDLTLVTFLNKIKLKSVYINAYKNVE